MPIDEITLDWFRGASSNNNLKLNGKSTVVFGPNGSGKSSFVDALEFTISGGSIKHLANEYSGKKLEKAIINVLKQTDQNCKISIKIGHDSACVAISANGTPQFDLPPRLKSWKRNSIILRQDEVSAFVLSDKSHKYSSLLPLIGLEDLEIAIENIKPVVKKLREQLNIEEDLSSIRRIKQKLGNAFDENNASSTKSNLKSIFFKYFSDEELPSLNKAVAKIRSATDPIYRQLDSVKKAFVIAETAQRLQLEDLLARTISAMGVAAKSAEPLIERRLNLLRDAKYFCDDEVLSVECPACGQLVESELYSSHVHSQLVRLEVARQSYAQKDECCAQLSEALGRFNSLMTDVDFVKQFSIVSDEDVLLHITSIRDFDRNSLKMQIEDLDLKPLITSIPFVQKWLDTKTAKAPPTTSEVVSEIEVLNLVDSYIELVSLEKKISQYQPLLVFLEKTQYELRREINRLSSETIKHISNDMQSMWSQLHPNEPIDEVSLDLQEGKDRAVDICLRFHGKSQNSPRITLSEGHRNSLGLVVFLAFAKKSTGPDIPLILDDIVTSFDREHRSSVSELLEKEFGDRQVVVFTHDDQWYTELRNRMTKWNFITLLPYRDPTIGIRGSIKIESFSIARDLIEFDASAAANKARGILDINMSFVAEKLEIPVPFVRGTKNDLRNCLDLVGRFQKRASEKMHRRVDKQTHQKCNISINAAVAVGQLLVPFGNAGSHGRYVTTSEAYKLINSCENLMKSLKCDDCETNIWHSRVENKHQNCLCDNLRWKD
jgi:recombinational DNA repair ATPase RecF